MFFDKKFCHICNVKTAHYNGDCGPCREAIESLERRDYFETRDEMTIEERLRSVEEWIYNKSKERPIIDR